MKRQLPKNVRQIGNVSDSSKVYVEDYVDTFFNQLCEKADSEAVGAFLVGEVVQEEETDYIYVYGAIRMKELETKGKEYVITEPTWKNACEVCKEFFGDAEILGWCIAGGEQPIEVNHHIQKMHQKYFQREKSLFVTKSGRDKEENFYIYKYKDLMECGGHYIYYEKNMEMQNYMISSRKKVGFTPSEIIEDRVTKNFRSIIREKEERNEQKSHSRLVYGISTFLVIIILVIGVNMMNNYEKMQEVKENLGEEQEESVEVSGQPIVQETEQEQEDEIEVEEETVVPEVLEVEKETYVVQKGDTLESISKQKYGDVLRVAEICELNQLEDGNLIFIGQKLLLP